MSRFPFNFLRRSTPPFTASLPAGLRIYAVGDIHGRLDRLLMLEAAIRRDVAARPPAPKPMVIFLGDYIDRGPDSRGVVNVLARKRFSGLEARFLLGNHEDALLAFLEDPSSGAGWLAFGGMATLASYGAKPAAEGAERGRMTQLSAALRTRLPDGHLSFFRSLELSIQLGDYLFVHAGVRPGRDLSSQQRGDLLTIREPFMSAAKLPWRVVHGHTVIDRAEFKPTRISLDTGAYATGVLSCAVIEGTQAELLDY